MKNSRKIILIGVLALCTPALAVRAQMRAVAHNAPLLIQEKDVSSRQLVAPGVGADTEDPKKILIAANQALSKVHSVAYEANYQGIGAFATRASVSMGSVKLVRLASGNPFISKLAAQGKSYRTGRSEANPFQVAFDGQTVFRLHLSEKSLEQKILSGSDPNERDLGFVTGFIGAGPYQLIMFEYILEDSFRKQINASTLEYEGRTVIDSIPCHVVYVEYDKQPNGRIRRERWFLSRSDYLPRKVEWLAVDDKGKHGAYVLTLSHVRTNMPLDDVDFRIRLRKGFKIRPHKTPNRPELLAVGELAPDWTMTEPGGKAHSLSSYRGKILLLDFWATWCGPCIQAMPRMQKLHEKYRDQGVVIFGVNCWEESDAATYMKEHDYKYTLLLNGETTAKAYQVGVLPTIYIIGIDGRIIYRGVGDSTDLDKVIESHLKKQNE